MSNEMHSGTTALNVDLALLSSLPRNLKKTMGVMSVPQARFLVDAYYTLQNYRIASDNQTSALSASEEPHEVIKWLSTQSTMLENQIKRALDVWTGNQPLGQWSRSITGVGPVIAAGFMAHIDITKAPTVGHIWRFAGLDPTSIWEKGKRRPWNASLKVLCWKLGESFVKVSNNESDYYGKVYAERKRQEIAANDELKFQEQANGTLAKKKIGKDTDAYKAYIQGKLPPAHIHSRAKRYAVKLFLAHYHHVAYELHYNTKPPRPYIIEHGGHVHFIAPPNWPMNSAGSEVKTEVE